MSPSSCVAVGSTVGTDGFAATLVETWNGSVWTRVPAADPSSLGAGLTAVSCPSATFCAAVGEYRSVATGQPRPFGEKWDGRSWTGVPMATGPGNRTVVAVSCSSSTMCMAVGSTQVPNSEQLAAEVWNGRAWSNVPVPVPAVNAQGSFEGVSCASARFCAAVGSYGAGSLNATLTETWDGTRWRSLPTAYASATTDPLLTGVSCTSATACVAVGIEAPAMTTGAANLAEGWNGTKWIVEQAVDSGAEYSGLAAVACSSAIACTAVGDARTDGALAVPESLYWNGRTWTDVATPTQSGTDALLDGVSCPAGRSCVAVGAYLRGADPSLILTEVAPSGIWAVKAAVNPYGELSPTTDLESTSCPQAGRCEAVGSYEGPQDDISPMAQSWNGTTWAGQPIPRLANFQSADLDGVSCASVVSCVAVGTEFNLFPADDGVGLIETWDGKAWSVATVPVPSGAPSTLSAVSCSGTGSCMAVGTYGRDYDLHPFSDYWDGTNWTLSYPPAPSGNKGGALSGVSCTPRLGCVAVGWYADSSELSVPLAERWQSSHWVEQGVTNAPTQARLTSVACSNGACFAVGDGIVGRTSPVTATLNGSTWTLSSPTVLAPNHSAGLQAISCSSAHSCTAVGQSTPGVPTIGSTAFTGAWTDTWDGTRWTTHAAAHPTGSPNSDLEAVSCPSTGTCEAVGTYQPRYLTSYWPLAESLATT